MPYSALSDSRASLFSVNTSRGYINVPLDGIMPSEIKFNEGEAASATYTLRDEDINNGSMSLLCEADFGDPYRTRFNWKFIDINGISHTVKKFERDLSDLSWTIEFDLNEKDNVKYDDIMEDINEDELLKMLIQKEN